MKQSRLTNPILYFMSVAAGLVVANVYYSQPLLHQIAADFQIGETSASNVVLASQLGYAFGLLIILPLGDMISNIKILKIDFAVMIAALLAAAFAPSIWVLSISCLFVGITSAIPQFFVPMAANLANDEQRPHAIGIMMTGLLVGIVGSRIISGFIGGAFGWRMMYALSAAVMVLLFAIIWLKLPRLQPHFEGTYPQLMMTLWRFFRGEKPLRLAIMRGALSFVGLTAMWTTLVFVMHDSFGHGSEVTGLFGLFGIVGALGASVVGNLNRYYSKNLLLWAGIILSLASWILFLFSTHWIVGIAIGIITVDLGQQVIHITNQNIIFARNPHARNRINTVYMFLFFIGGSLGASLGSLSYELYKWEGVSLFGLGVTAVLAIWHFVSQRHIMHG